jgi:hypothetical protein
VSLARLRAGDQSRDIESLLLELSLELELDLVVEAGLSGEDPSLLELRLTDESPLVVGVDVDDPVVSREGREEGDLELALSLIDSPGFSFDLRDIASS